MRRLFFYAIIVHNSLKRLNLYELIPLFDEIIISSEVKLVKPGSEIYQLALDRMQAKPEESVMIDDNIVNVNGAKQIGIAGILYTNVNSLIEELKQDLNCCSIV